MSDGFSFNLAISIFVFIGGDIVGNIVFLVIWLDYRWVELIGNIWKCLCSHWQLTHVAFYFIKLASIVTQSICLIGSIIMGNSGILLCNFIIIALFCFT